MRLSIRLALLALFLQSVALFAQFNWQGVIEPVRNDRQIIPASYRTVGIDGNALRDYLMQAPHENTVAAKHSDFILELPMPDGTQQRFSVVYSPIMEEGLAQQFPEIRTYLGQGIDDRTAIMRCDFTPQGFHGIVIGQSGSIYIDPYAPGETDVYISYRKTDFYATTNKVFDELPPVYSDLEIPENNEKSIDGKEGKKTKPDVTRRLVQPMGFQKMTPFGTQLRQYRLALACTGEYAQFHGGTVAGALAAMVTSMNRVNGIYERDASIRMNIIANNNLIIYLNGATDPYTNNNGGTMLNENQTNIDAVIGSANYDIGHVFSTGGGGIAQLNSPCGSGKARGVTGSGAPVGDPFDVDYVAHEMGHQFGGNHTQNNSCNRASSAAYEPGSATTIMGYAGICPPNLQSNSDDHFHNHSINEIHGFAVSGNGNTCAAISSTGNTVPTVEAGVGGWTIPISTPFELTAVGNDADGDLITYNWEQYDLGPATAAGDNTLTNPSGNQPIFRSWPSTISPTRVFPRVTDLVNNTTTIGEHLPTYTRSLRFRCTVRDNNAGAGGVQDDEVLFNVTDAAGPFLVTAPNTAVTYTGNTSQTITWNVAGTNIAPVSATNVDIFLSTDGGFTWPFTLATGTPNDGSHNVTIPNVPTTQARIKVKGAGNIFFDISNTNFTILPGSSNANDVVLTGITSPSGTLCASSVAGELNIFNPGTNTVTSMTITYNVDGGANQVFNWTGSLATGGSTTVTLPALAVAAGPHTFNATVTQVNGVADADPSNNSASSAFTLTSGEPVTFTLLTDCWGEETSWVLEDAANNVIQSVGTNTLGDQILYTYDFCLATGCYELRIGDTFGDGLDGTASGCAIDGDYQVTGPGSVIYVDMTVADFDNLAVHPFCIGGGTPGCTNPLACNFNPLADIEDGSCIIAPANDACANAVALTQNAAPVTGDNRNTCVNAANPTCGNNGTQPIADVWYSFVYNGGDLVVRTSAATGSPLLTDTRLAVFSACGGTQVACNDDIGGGNFYSSISLGCAQLIVGQTYYIQAGGYGNLTGLFNIEVDFTDVLGCTNPIASNYNPCATVSNGSCIILGCTNPAACNFNGSANQDDGSCTLPQTWYLNADGDLYAVSTISSCFNPGAGYSSSPLPLGDCNDNNAAIFPGATEVCDGVDNDCDGLTDEGLGVNWYIDGDNDGFGAGAPTLSCTSPGPGYVLSNSDCDDNDSLVYPGAPEICDGQDNDCNGQVDDGLLLSWYFDGDGDGFGAGAPLISCVNPGPSYVLNDDDCNDLSSITYPGAPELCDGQDNDCDGQTDEGLGVNWYVDSDGDGFGAIGSPVVSCASPGPQYVNTTGDCNDNNANTYPGAPELCDSQDNDCDGQTDEGIVNQNWYFDGDGDGVGGGSPVSACVSPGAGWVLTSGDCDDSNNAIYPFNSEICDGLDNDCDGFVDEGAGSNWYLDNDGDGYGTGAAVLACTQPGLNYSLLSGDCDDADSNTYPGAAELCDGLDNDCDGLVDDGASPQAWYLDSDGDGFGAGSAVLSCVSPGPNYTLVSGDCNNSNATVYPGAPEVCDGLDNDCDTQVDEGLPLLAWYLDNDGDFNAEGFTSNCASPGAGWTTTVMPIGDCNGNNALVYPGAPELCDGLDNDCDGITDEGCPATNVPNDNRPFAQIVAPQPFGVCNTTGGTVNGATVSPECTSAVITGEDVWYRFTANSPGVRIVAQTNAFDAVIELQDNAGNTIATENVVSGVGTEILNHYDAMNPLVNGATYFIAVRNFDSSQGTGTFGVCVQRLRASTCNFGPGPYQTCNIFKAVHVAAQSYTFSFTNQTTSVVTNVTTTNGITTTNLSALLPGFTYNVGITATYQLADGAGNPEVISIATPNACSIVMAPHTNIELRSLDWCAAGPKTPFATLTANTWLCGALNYEWRFKQTFPVLDVDYGPAYPGPAASRFFFPGFLGLQPGATYDVEVRPVYAGPFNGNWSATPRCLEIIGNASAQQQDAAYLPDVAGQNGLLVQPNPSDGERIRMITDIPADEEVMVQVMDAGGRVVFSTRWVSQGENQHELVFPQTLMPGVYMLRVNADSGSQSVRMVIAR